MDVYCIGLAVMDILASPVCREDFDVDSIYLETLEYQSGGDALNAAINMASLGLEVSLIGRAGNDSAGKSLLKAAADAGVNTERFILDEECPTSTSIVMVDKNGNRHFAYHGKCNDRLSIEDMDISAFEKGSIVHVGSAMALASLDGPGLTELFKKAKEKGCITSMDVTWDRSGKWLEKIDAALAYTDFFLPSLNEARLITKRDEPEEIARFFSSYGISKFVIKMGEKGCFATDFKDSHYIPSLKHSNVVDTTGAGDAFVSGFLFGAKRGLDILSCARLGSLVASEAIGCFGSTTGIRKKFLHRRDESEKIIETAMDERYWEAQA